MQSSERILLESDSYKEQLHSYLVFMYLQTPHLQELMNP